jgi:hypothetical protein
MPVRTSDRLESMSATSKLQKHGIVTLNDLDQWIAVNPRVIDRGPYKGQREFMSRYQALKLLVGENAAIEMLNNLAIDQCTPSPSTSRRRR